MRIGRLIIPIILFSSIALFPQEKVVLREREALDITKLMEEHQIYVTRIQDLDFDEEGKVYILDNRSANVVVVDLKTGSLINRISAMGQGPTELMMPYALRIRNKKVFILSSGFIKTFSVRGEFLRTFKPEIYPRELDVDRDENIYVSGIDRMGNPIISVYNALGNFIRIAFTLQLEKKTLENRGESYKNQSFYFRLDQEGNIIILHHKLRKLTKVSPSGGLLWEKKIENDLLKPFYKNEGTVYDEQGYPTVTGIINEFDIDRDNNIVIAHVGGGCIYSPRGELTYIMEVKFEEPHEGARTIRFPRIIKDRLLAVFTQSQAILFPYILSKNLH